MKTTGLNFVEAVKAAKNGKKIRQASWRNDDSLKLVCGLLGHVATGQTMFLSAEHWLANDWEIVQDHPKTMGFMEAWAEAKKGKKIARLEWTNGGYAKIHSERLCMSQHDPMLISKFYIDATDWYVVTEPKEQELKPCKCGYKDVKCYRYKRRLKICPDWTVLCPVCGTRLTHFATRAEAIAAWNNYVDPAPAPKWTSEIPKDEGRYVVRFDNMHYDIAVIIDAPAGRSYMGRNGDIVLLKDIVSAYPNMIWFPLPPLPAEKEDTP